MGKRILIVDDNERMTRRICMVLKNEGYTTIPLKNAEIALTAIRHRQCRYDLALVDLSLEGYDGTEVVSESKRYYPHTPVVAMSVHGYVPDEADEFFDKFENGLSELPGLVEKVLSGEDV